MQKVLSNQSFSGILLLRSTQIHTVHLFFFFLLEATIK